MYHYLVFCILAQEMASELHSGDTGDFSLPTTSSYSCMSLQM